MENPTRGTAVAPSAAMEKETAPSSTISSVATVPSIGRDPEKAGRSSGGAFAATGENTAAPQQPSPPQPALQPPAREGNGEGRHTKINNNTQLIVLSLCVCFPQNAQPRHIVDLHTYFSAQACVFLSALDQTIITTAIPVIAGEFDSPTAYTWIGSSYLLASAAFVPPPPSPPPPFPLLPRSLF